MVYEEIATTTHHLLSYALETIHAVGGRPLTDNELSKTWTTYSEKLTEAAAIINGRRPVDRVRPDRRAPAAACGPAVLRGVAEALSWRVWARRTGGAGRSSSCWQTCASWRTSRSGSSPSWSETSPTCPKPTVLARRRADGEEHAPRPHDAPWLQARRHGRETPRRGSRSPPPGASIRWSSAPRNCGSVATFQCPRLPTQAAESPAGGGQEAVRLGRVLPVPPGEPAMAPVWAEVQRHDRSAGRGAARPSTTGCVTGAAQLPGQPVSVLASSLSTLYEAPRSAPTLPPPALEPVPLSPHCALSNIVSNRAKT